MADVKGGSISHLYRELEHLNFNLVMKTGTGYVDKSVPKLKNSDEKYDIGLQINRLFRQDAKRADKFARDKRTQYEVFKSAMNLMLLIGHLLGLNPVTGLYEKDMSKIRLNYFSWRYFHCFSTCLLHGIFTIFALYAILNEPIFLNKLAAFSFYFTTFFSCFLFLRVAGKWPSVMKRLYYSGLDEYVDPNIKCKCYITTIIFTIAGVVEHSLASIQAMSYATDCLVNGDMYDEYIHLLFSWVSEFSVPYHKVFGFFLQITLFISELIWCYSDLFVICISLYLSSILDRINKKILSVEGQLPPPVFWKSIREDFFRATSLIQAFDDVINGIAFSSFANNLFFVCMRLVYFLGNGLGVNQANSQHKCPNYPSGPFIGYENVIYFSYGLVFILSRSLAVSLIVARVNTTSIAAAPVLFNIPSAGYCNEIQRLIDHMHGDTIALTGMNLFYITKQLVVKIAATVITYELVLIQIKTNNGVKF